MTAMLESFDSEDFKEGVSHYIEKRNQNLQENKIMDIKDFVKRENREKTCKRIYQRRSI